MTRPRLNISESLARRGRPENWATDDEAAALSGMSPNVFARAVPELEKKGFPQINAVNRKRFIPHILAFWERGSDDAAAGSNPPAQDERLLEKWN